MAKASKTPKVITAGDLRKLIKKQKLSWQVDSRLSDDDLLPFYSEIGNIQEDTLIKDKAIERPSFLDTLPLNPFLQERWKELGLSSGKEEPLTGSNYIN